MQLDFHWVMKVTSLLWSYCSASFISEGGFLLLVKHGLQLSLYPVLAADFLQTRCRIRFLLLRNMLCHIPFRVIPAGTGFHGTQIAFRTGDGLQRPAQFLCESGIFRCATSSSNTSRIPQARSRGVSPLNNPGHRGFRVCTASSSVGRFR